MKLRACEMPIEAAPDPNALPAADAAAEMMSALIVLVLVAASATLPCALIVLDWMKALVSLRMTLAASAPAPAAPSATTPPESAAAAADASALIVPFSVALIVTSPDVVCSPVDRLVSNFGANAPRFAHRVVSA